MKDKFLILAMIFFMIIIFFCFGIIYLLYDNKGNLKEDVAESERIPVTGLAITEAAPYDLMLIDEEKNKTLTIPFEDIKFVENKKWELYNYIYPNYKEETVVYIWDKALALELLRQYTMYSGKEYEVEVKPSGN